MKFFRNFRQKLNPGNGIRKYILYAIGEIILVAIGILIALAVNNFNEQNKLKESTLKTAEQVLQKMKRDTTEIATVFKIWKQYESSIELVLYKTEQNEPVSQECVECENVLFITELPDISTKVNDLIARDKLISGAIETELYQIDELYKEILYTNKIYVDRIAEALVDNLKYLKDNHAWFAQFIGSGRCNNDCQDYFSNSPDYRNRVAYLNQIAYQSYYNHLYETNEKISKHIEKLEQLLNEE
ncbi:MAG: DUF6090 family protein [Patiriisocius sp.]|uniref:DUF6090 family protein n=1 Tax=Patiriisocius sp. TaxID=2822396 RepID=UPI003EF3908E